MSGVSAASRGALYPVRTFSTTGSAVSGSANAGWISGTPASLAASATVNVIFDLGADWVYYPYVRVFFLPVGPSSGFGSTTISSAASVGGTLIRQGPVDTDSINTTFLTISTTNGAQTIDIRPMNRYLYVSITKADGANAVGSTARVDITQYPC